MKTMKISFIFTEIKREKGKVLIFHVIFFNKHISITNADIILKFCMSVLHIISKGSLSQFFYLGPRFFLLDLQNNVLKILKKLPDFLHKMKTKP